MSIINITELRQAQPDKTQVVLLPAIASENVTITGTSAQSSALNSSTVLVRLVADASCYVQVGANPTAAAGDTYLPSGVVEYFAIQPGAGYKIAAITA